MEYPDTQARRKPGPPEGHVPWASRAYVRWPMADVVAKGGIGRLRVPRGASGTRYVSMRGLIGSRRVPSFCHHVTTTHHHHFAVALAGSPRAVLAARLRERAEAALVLLE